jgi:KUP system potassium uptake protein
MLVLIFGASQKLADAYGMAVSFTLAIDTILFIVVARIIWKKSVIYLVTIILAFLSIDLLFVSSSLTKLLTGGWFPLTLAALILIVITTWIKGQRIVNKKRRALEGPLQEFVEEIHNSQPPIIRVPGDAIYIGHHSDLAPLALHATVEKLRELHTRVIIVTVGTTNESHIPEDERATFNGLGYQDGICHVNLSYGFHDSPNVPRTLESLRNINPELNFDPDTTEYFISQSKIMQTKRKDLAGWRKSLYCLMARNAVSTSDYYKLPTNRTIEIRSLIEI